MDSETVLGNLREPVLALDRDGRITFTNDRFLAVTGLAREESVGTEFAYLESHAEDGFESLVEAVGTVGRAESDEERVEVTMRHPEEAPVPRRLPVEARVTPLVEGDAVAGVLVVLRDVSERTEKERKLERSQRRFEAVLETPDSFVGILEPDGSLITANSRAMELVDVAPTDVTGDPFPGTPWWNHDEDLQDRLRDWIDRAAAGEFVRFEAVHESADGDALPVEGVVRPVRDEDGVVVSLIVEAHDVSERRESQRELERQNERLDRFAEVLSHDLRNPLNVAQGRLSLAREGRDSDDLDAVARSLDRMETLIDGILALARAGDDAVEPAPVDLATVVTQSWETVGTADASLGIEIDRSVSADRERLGRLFENLFRNAIEHAGEDVTVTVGHTDDGFFVADDGAGVPESEHEEIFDAGYSTAAEGTGLGLSIVETIADAHGWTVAATSAANGGVRFDICDVEFV
jgi:PAS domain S-box-containing protein